MRPAAAAALSILLASALGAPAGAREETPAPAAREGEGVLSEDLIASLDVYEGQIEKLRGAPFESKVRTAALSHEGVRAYMRDLIHKEYPGADLAAEEAAMRYFGFLGEDQSIEPILLTLLEAQVAGVYDPERKTLYVVPGPVTGAIALVHELDHALMDQHYDLAALEEKAKDDDDRSLALSALLEGEATMTMSLWMMQRGLDPKSEPLIGAGGEDLMASAQAGLAQAPVFVKESLIFPYLQGATWASDVMRRGGGLPALDAYFRDPPSTTEQILHPERSISPRDEPSAIDPSLVEAGLPAGAKVVKRNTMGEFALRLLLGKPGDVGAERAAEGWDGDRYVLAGPEDGRVLAWATVWDTEGDAQEFLAAISAWGAARRKGAGGDLFAARSIGRVVLVSEGPAAPSRLQAMISRLEGAVTFH